MTKLLACLCCSPFLLAQDDSSRQVREFIERLRSENAEERGEATRQLKRIGKTATLELEKAARNGDAEVASRARAILAVLALREQLPAWVLEKSPGADERLAVGDDHAWTEVFSDAVEKMSWDIPRSEARFFLPKAVSGARTSHEWIQVCQWASRWDFRPAIPTIIPLLKDESFEVTTAAIYSLWLLQATEALPDLRNLMKEESVVGRANAAWLLRYLRIREATPDLMALLKDPDVTVRMTAAGTMGHLRIKEAAPHLLEWLKDPDPALQAAAAEALGSLEAHEAIPALLRLLPDEDVRLKVITALGKLKAKESILHLLKFLTDEDSKVRTETATALSWIGEAEMGSKLAPLLQDPDRHVQVAVIRGLGRLRCADASAEIAKRFKDPEALARQEAIDAVIDLGGTAAVGELTGVLGNEDETLRGTAAYVLGRLGARESVVRLLPLLEDPSEDVRRLAADALAAIGASEALPALRRRIREEKNDVACSRSVEAVARLAGREAFPDLATALKRDKSMIESRTSAIRLLGKLKLPEAAPSLRAVLKDPDEDEDVRADAAVALSRLLGAEAIPDLLALLKDYSWREPEVAAALGSLGPKAKEDVARLLADPDRGTRLLAARSLCRMGSREGIRVLLDDAESTCQIDLNALNGVRQPDLWRRLQEEDRRWELRGDLRGEDDLQYWMERLSGLPMDKSEVGPTTGFSTPGKKALGSRLRSLERLSTPFILEPDRIRILSPQATLRFWQRWWADLPK